MTRPSSGSRSAIGSARARRPAARRGVPPMMRLLGELAVRAPRRVLGVAAAFAVVAAASASRRRTCSGAARTTSSRREARACGPSAAVEAASGLSAAPQVLVLVREPTARRLARVVAVDPFRARLSGGRPAAALQRAAARRWSPPTRGQESRSGSGGRRGAGRRAARRRSRRRRWAGPPWRPSR